MESAVIHGVPRVHFYQGGPRCPEDICFPSVLRALLEHGRDSELCCRKCGVRGPGCRVECTYAWLVGATGAASYLSWRPGWHPDNNALQHMTPDPLEPYRRGFEAAGLDVVWVGPPAGPRDEAAYREAIVESVGRGVPVVGFGVVGPDEPCLIAGFENAGDTVLGWSFFQHIPPFSQGVTEDAAGHFRKTGWFPDTARLAVPHEGTRPAADITARRALEWLVAVSRGAEVPGRHTGQAAYTAWAEALRDDAAFPASREDTLRARHMAHDGAVGQVAEARWYGAVFLMEALRHLHYRAAPHLLEAAACYTAEHELMWRIWDLAGGNGNPQAHLRLAVPEVRAAMIGVIHTARDKETQAAGHMERALEAL